MKVRYILKKSNLNLLASITCFHQSLRGSGLSLIDTASRIRTHIKGFGIPYANHCTIAVYFIYQYVKEPLFGV